MEKYLIKANLGDMLKELRSIGEVVFDAKKVDENYTTENVTRTFVLDSTTRCARPRHESDLVVQTVDWHYCPTKTRMVNGIHYIDTEWHKIFANTKAAPDASDDLKDWTEIVTINPCEIVIENVSKETFTVRDLIGVIEWPYKECKAARDPNTKVLVVTENGQEILTFIELLEKYPNEKVIGNFHLNAMGEDDANPYSLVYVL